MHYLAHWSACDETVCMYVGWWLPVKRSDWNEGSSLDIAVSPDLIRGGSSMQWYVLFFLYVCLYVCMYVWMYSSWWLLKNISPSIPIGERYTAMKRSMAGKGTTRDGWKMEQQVFMVRIPLCMYVCKLVNGKVWGRKMCYCYFSSTSVLYCTR